MSTWCHGPGLDRRLAEPTSELTTRMLTITVLGLAAVTALLAAVT